MDQIRGVNSVYGGIARDRHSVFHPLVKSVNHDPPGGCGQLPAIAPWILGAVVIVCLMLAATLAWRPIPILVWNVSASAPRGLYLVRRQPAFRAGEIAVAWLPPAARRLADRRHYLPFNVPLVKMVAAVHGARVCARGATISINGRVVAQRLVRDLQGRRMRWWSGCVRLARDEYLLLSRSVPDAYDGRYFGISKAAAIVGSGRLLWRS